MRLVRRAALTALVLTTTIVTTAGPAFAVAPANDTYAGRTIVGSIPFADSVDTTEATTDALDAQLNPTICGAPATDASVWYELTAASGGFVGVDVSQSSYSAGVLVATGTPDNFTFVTCGPGAVAFETVVGETYTILAIDDQEDGGGNGGVLNITFAEVPPPPNIDITVNRFGTVNTRTGSATVSGTVTCSSDAVFAFLETQLSQNVGRVTIRGFGGSDLTCDGTSRPWSVEVVADNGRFAGGKAVSITFAFACGQFLCGDDFEERTVQLRGGKR